jgi:hypothetical protein
MDTIIYNSIFIAPNLIFLFLIILELRDQYSKFFGLQTTPQATEPFSTPSFSMPSNDITPKSENSTFDSAPSVNFLSNNALQNPEHSTFGSNDSNHMVQFGNSPFFVSIKDKQSLPVIQEESENEKKRKFDEIEES